MNRFLLFSLVVLASGVGAMLLSTSVDSQPIARANVLLQASTPGTAQSGHVNVTGTSIAGQHVGGGIGLTGLNADNIASGTLNDSRIPNNIVRTGQTQTITGNKTFSGSNTFSNATLPFSVASQNMVPNLNADLLDGQHGAYYQNAANINAGLLGTGFGGLGLDTSNLSAGSILVSAGGGNWSSLGVGAEGQVLGVSGGDAAWRSDSIALPFSGTSSSLHPFAVESTSSLWGVGVEGRAPNDGGTGLMGIGRGWGVQAMGIGWGAAGIEAEGDGGGVRGRATSTYLAVSGVWGSAVSPTGYGGRFANTEGVGLTAKSDEHDAMTATAIAPARSGLYANHGATTGSAYGIYGQSNSGLDGFGVWAAGRLGASGLKLFRIDHPYDPENKYLQHYCTEGSQPLNVYSGNVVTDQSGSAWITLPDYCEEINRDFRYQLTVIDDRDAEFVMAKVSRKISGNRFQVRTSQPHTEVSWRVEGVRNDRWVRRYGAPIEVEKDAFERGTYQHPELWDQPVTKGLRYQEPVKELARPFGPRSH